MLPLFFLAGAFSGVMALSLCYLIESWLQLSGPGMERLPDSRAVGTAEQFAHPLTGGGQLVEVYPRAHAKAVQQIDTSSEATLPEAPGA